MLFVRLSIVFILLSSTLIGCASLNLFQETKTKAAPAPQKEKQTLTELKKKNPSSPDTFKKLKAFVDENQENDLALKASLYLGKLLKKQNRQKEACEVYKQALSLPFNYTDDLKVSFLYSDCLFRAKQVTAALELLETQFDEETPSHIRKKIIKKQWRFLKNNRLPYWKLLVLNRLVEYAPPSLQKQRIEQGEAFIHSLTRNELLNLEKNFSSLGVFQGELFSQAGKREWQERNFIKSKYYFQQAVKILPPGSENSKRARNYLKMLKSRLFVNPYLIGVILPLSGHRKALGEKVLKGLSLGLGLIDNSPWQLMIMDSGSHPDITQQAVETLLYKHHVIGIVGGLSGDTAQVIANIGEKFGIPCLLLSQKQSLTKDRIFVFQSALSGEALMEHLTENLIQNLKVTKAAVLFPEDNYGKNYVELFTKNFQNKGGHIVKEESYKVGEVDFKTPIKKLVNLFYLKSRQKEYETLKQKLLEKNPNLNSRHKKLIPELLLKPEVDFQALFIPDSLKVLRQVVSYLKYFNIKGIYLVGTNLWKREKLTNQDKDFSLVFSDTIDIPNFKLQESPFYIKYYEAFRTTPGFFEKQAYNTALALKTALLKKPKDRFQLQKALESIESFQGAFSNLKISKDHTFLHPLKFYKIESKSDSVK